LSHANANWTDKVIPMPEWPELKTSVPNEQLPCIEFYGKKMGQSFSISRYLGKIYGYYPESPLKAFTCDMLIDTFADVLPKIPQPTFIRDPL